MSLAAGSLLREGPGNFSRNGKAPRQSRRFPSKIIRAALISSGR